MADKEGTEELGYAKPSTALLDYATIAHLVSVARSGRVRTFLAGPP